jgi:hypothetical protein
MVSKGAAKIEKAASCFPKNDVQKYNPFLLPQEQKARGEVFKKQTLRFSQSVRFLSKFLKIKTN